MRKLLDPFLKTRETGTIPFIKNEALCTHRKNGNPAGQDRDMVINLNGQETAL
nr:hypothetical protein [uncultured Desulfosarcina sp.]